MTGSSSAVKTQQLKIVETRSRTRYGNSVQRIEATLIAIEDEQVNRP